MHLEIQSVSCITINLVPNFSTEKKATDCTIMPVPNLHLGGGGGAGITGPVTSTVIISQYITWNSVFFFQWTSNFHVCSQFGYSRIFSSSSTEFVDGK